MIDLKEEAAFWEFCAQKNSYIQHIPGKVGNGNRFARFNDEGTIGENTKLDSEIRLELRDAPIGSLAESDSSFMHDTMYRTVRVIGKVAQNDFTARIDMQQRCKAALFEIVQYAAKQQQDGDACSSNILKYFNVNRVQYEVLENATSDSSFTGVLMKVQFMARIKPVAAQYGAFVYPANT